MSIESNNPASFFGINEVAHTMRGSGGPQDGSTPREPDPSHPTGPDRTG